MPNGIRGERGRFGGPIFMRPSGISNSSINTPNDDRHLTGLIDELIIFRQDLTATEIRGVHAVGRPED